MSHQQDIKISKYQLLMNKCKLIGLTLFRMRGEQGPEGLPTSFPPAASTNVGTNPQNLLTFGFDSFATMSYLVPVPH